MQDIVELERRLTAALGRIDAGIARLTVETADEGQAGPADAGEIARLTEALDEERMANAQLNERLRVLKAREDADAGESHAETEELKAQLAGQADEIATLRRVLAEAGKEIASLRAARAAEAAELAEVVAALDPLVEEAEHA
jgi:septal ring factor EnvC (AmiA/AmiB activator)